MFKNVASQKVVVYAFDSTTNLPKTGDAANLTTYVNKDFAGVNVLGDTSATEVDATNAKGYYIFDLTQAETNGDCLLFSAKSTTSNIVVLAMPAVVFTTPANFTALAITAGGIAQADLQTIKTQSVTCAGGVTVPAATLASTTNITAGTIATVTTLTNLPAITANWLTAAGIAASALNGKGDWMVSYTQPTGFLAATFPSGTVANTTNITAGTIATVTNQLTAAQIATGLWQDTTAGDFTTASSIGKSLYTSGAVPGAAGGHFIAGTNAATTVTTSFTTTFTGNLTGSVNSITNGVTVTTNNDKTGYSLTVTPPTSTGIATAVWSGDRTLNSLTITGALTTGGISGGLDSVSVAGQVTAPVNLFSVNQLGVTSITSATSTTIVVVTPAANTTAAELVGNLVYVADASGNHTQTRTIQSTSFASNNLTVTVDRPWTTTPSNTWTATFLIGNQPFCSTAGAISTVTAVTGLTASNLDAAVSGRMATYTQPTGFLAATFPSTVSSYTGGDTSGTTTLLTRVTAAVALAGSAPSWYSAPVDVSSNVIAIKAKTDHLPSSDIVHTTGKLWVLDGSGNAVAPASATTTIQSKTDNLPAAPASTTNITAGTITTVTNLTNAPTVGDFTSTMKTSLNAATPIVSSVTVSAFTAGAITDAAFSFPGESAGRPTTFMAAVRRVWEWMTNNKNRDRSTGVVSLRNASDTGNLEAQTQSTTGTTDSQSQGA